MSRKQEALWPWVPLMVTVAAAVITLAVYTCTTNTINPIVYWQLAATSLVPGIFPLWSVATKKSFPLVINAVVASHILLASHLGSALSFYSRIGWWDLFMHGYFGFVAAVVLYTLLLKWGGEHLNRWGFLLLIFLGVMGGAAVWEVFEYVADFLFGGDAQRVQQALAEGVSPIRDTMTDILITMAGVAAFYVGLWADKRCGYPVSRKICKETK